MQQESLIEHKFCKFTEVYLLEIIFLYLTFIIGKKISPIFMSFCFSTEEKNICSSSMSRPKGGGGDPATPCTGTKFSLNTLQQVHVVELHRVLIYFDWHEAKRKRAEH